MCGMRRVLTRLASCVPFTKRCLSSAPDRSKYALSEVVQDLKSGTTQRVVVMAGAGISTASGIPDFRSPGTGLYSNLQKYPTLPYPEAIFDLDYFFRDPRPFFTLAQELYPSTRYWPNTVHYFIRLLHEKGLLQRLYTQNIDGLERLAGIPTEKMVEAHGTFATATCCRCGQTYKGEEIKTTILDGEIPYCTKTKCEGVIKPDIVFFGENLPDRFYLHTIDVPQAELLLIMGTSLEVYPFAGIADLVLPGTPRILINRDIAGPFRYQPRDNDIAIQGDLVGEVLKFCESLGWSKELEKLQRTCEESAKEQ